MFCCFGGRREDTSDAFQVLSGLPDIGVVLDRSGGRPALCVEPETLTVFKSPVGVTFVGLFYSINHILDKEKGCAH